MRSSANRNGHPQKSPPGRGRYVLSEACLRSAITNGSAMLAGLDHRSAWARRLRDLIASLTSDLGGDGQLSEAERQLIRRAAMLSLQAELIEARWAKNGGEAPDKSLDSYQRTTGSLRRVLRDLGLKRRPRNVTPTLDQYLAQNNCTGVAE